MTPPPRPTRSSSPTRRSTVADTSTATVVAPPRPRAGGRVPRGDAAPRSTSRSGRKTLTAYLFLAPFLVLFITFVVVPAVFGLWMSLTNWSPFRDTQEFIGLENYINLFTPGNNLAD